MAAPHLGCAVLAAQLAFAAALLSGCGTDQPRSVIPPRSIIVELSAGAKHACAAFDDGKLRCWGANNYGQVGQTPRTSIQGQAQTVEHDSVTAPQTVAGLPSFSGVMAGITQTCVFASDRSLACWGGIDWARGPSSPLRYQGDASYVTPPVFPIAQLNGISQASFGARHVCGLVAEGQVACWGENSAGQLGVNSTEQYPTAQPTVVPGLPPAVQVAAGTFASCAVLHDGTVQCWGDNWTGQGASTVPQIIEGFTGVAALSMHRHGCARLLDGSVACLGESGEGQAGQVISGPGAFSVDGLAAATTLAPLQTIDIGGAATQVAVGRTFSCALRGDQQVLCWGSNAHGQLGRGVGPDVLALDPAPAMVVGLGAVSQLVTGDEFACALQGGGTLLCWGSNADGQLGIGVPAPEFPFDTDDAPHPTPERVSW
ncbi:MAG: hypothetical protein ABIQ16_14525 [Polyangiaceae bacterium]